MEVTFNMRKTNIHNKKGTYKLFLIHDNIQRNERNILKVHFKLSTNQTFL